MFDIRALVSTACLSVNSEMKPFLNSPGLFWDNLKDLFRSPLTIGGVAQAPVVINVARRWRMTCLKYWYDPATYLVLIWFMIKEWYSVLLYCQGNPRSLDWLPESVKHPQPLKTKGSCFRACFILLRGLFKDTFSFSCLCVFILMWILNG